MALRSELLSGDPKLEAAASVDGGHITPGSKGEHVRKIQLALIQLDGAAIEADGSYGPKTAAAVLAYKQKRDIVNRTRQTSADNIVGIMTMASLDDELSDLKVVPKGSVRITPVGFSRVRSPRPQALVSLLSDSQPLGVNGSSNSLSLAPRIIPPNGGSNVVIELQRNSESAFVVENAFGGEVVVADTNIATIAEAGILFQKRGRAIVGGDPQTFRVFSGKTLGETTITATSGTDSASINVVVKTFQTPPVFHPGINHGHKPSGQYARVKESPNNNPTLIGVALGAFCQLPLIGPAELVGFARNLMFTKKPIALKHLDFYLTVGKGADFNEDRNISDWLRRDIGIRQRLKREIFARGRRPKSEGQFLFLQDDFGKDEAGEDFQHAFGAIDRVDYEVDFGQDTVRVWFQDRYEWHPFYPFYDAQPGTAEFPSSADGIRETNCLHAAMVELKTSGAADYWMKGVGEINLSVIAAS